VLPALTIADLYKSRWQIELFFKWIKGHLHLRRFLGNSVNAVKTQIWIAVSVYVLLAILKKQLATPLSLHAIHQILSVNAFEKENLPQLLNQENTSLFATLEPNQLSLEGF
jgi:IS4 transposase